MTEPQQQPPDRPDVMRNKPDHGEDGYRVAGDDRAHAEFGRLTR